mgnify:FL=1
MTQKHTPEGRPSSIAPTDKARGTKRRGGQRTMISVITYDWNQGIFSNPQPLIQAIQVLGPWCKYMDRTWFVATNNMSVHDIAGYLGQHLGPQDRLVVVRLTVPYDGWLPQEAYEWINQMYPQWGYS